MILSKDNTIKSAASAINRRIGDPILGTYTILFVLLNWKIFLFLFSNIDVDKKISTIESLLHPDALSWSLFGEDWLRFITLVAIHPLVLPAILAVIFLFGFPFILRPAYKKILEFKVENENDISAAEEKFLPIARKIEGIETSLRAEVQRVNDLLVVKSSLEQAVETQKRNILELEKSRDTALQEIAEMKSNRLTKSDDPVVHAAISTLDEQGLVESFAKYAKLLLVRSYRKKDFLESDVVFIQKLIKVGVIKTDTSPGGLISYSLTNVGIKTFAHLISVEKRG